MRSPVACALALLALTAALCLAPSPATAQFPPKTRYLTYDALAAELRSAPFRPEFRDEVVASLRLSMPLYTFLDLNRDSTVNAPEGVEVYSVKEDTMGDIEAFAKQTFNSEYDMNDALARIFVKLNDAHTAYGRPYAGYAFSLPLRTQSRMADAEGGDQRQGIFVSEIEGVYDIYASVYGSSPLANLTNADTGAPAAVTSIEGFEIESIDGVGAVEYFWQMAGDESPVRVGISKEQHTRFNLLTHGFSADPAAPPGWWAYRSQTRMGIPDSSRVTLTLRDTKSEANTRYTLPLFFVGMAPQKNEPGMLAAESLLPEPQHLPRHPVLADQALEHHWWSIHSLQHPALYEQRRALMGERAGPLRAPMAYEQLTPDAEGAASLPGKISFRVLEDDTGVLQINTFNPGDADLDKFLQVLQESVTNHQQNMKGSRLIVDLRSNGGGDICLGYAVLRFLFPQITSPLFSDNAANQPFGRYDMQQSALTQYLATLGAQSQQEKPINNSCGFFTPCYWLNPHTEMPFADDTWWNSGRSMARGGGEAKQYSALFHDACAEYFLKLAPPQINAGYLPDNVVMVADGMCGSTCAVFSSFVLEHGLAKLLSLGGVPDPTINGGLEGMQSFSFSGGQVADFDEVLEIVDSYGVPRNHSLVPQPYSNGARQSFTFREIYHWKDTDFTYPHEFRRFPAHFHSLYTKSFTDTDSIYALALGYLGSDVCAEGVSDLACEVRNGTGVFQCIDGVRGEECMATGCNPGNMLEQGGPQELPECVPCPTGFFQPFAGSDDQCVPCEVPAQLVLPEDGSIECDSEFTAEGWINDDCPFTVTCTTEGSGSGGGKKHKGGISPTVFWLIVVALAILALVLLLAVLNMRRKLQHANMAAFDGQVGFTRMEA